MSGDLNSLASYASRTVRAPASYWQGHLSEIFGCLTIESSRNEIELTHSRTAIGRAELVVGAGPPIRVLKPSNPAVEPGRICVFLVRSGRVHIRHAGRGYDMGEGQLAVFDQTKELVFDYGTPYQICSLMLPRSVLAPAGGRALESLNCAIDTGRGAARAIDALLSDFAVQGESERRADDDDYAWLDIVSYSIRSLQENASAFHLSEGARIARARCFVRANCANEELRRDHVAAHVGTSVRTLNRLLEQHDTSISRLIAEARMERAERMLADPRHRGLTVSTIAHEAGFSDLRHFIRRFRQTYGVPPSRYRSSQ